MNVPHSTAEGLGEFGCLILMDSSTRGCLFRHSLILQVLAVAAALEGVK